MKYPQYEIESQSRNPWHVILGVGALILIVVGLLFYLLPFLKGDVADSRLGVIYATLEPVDESTSLTIQKLYPADGTIEPISTAGSTNITPIFLPDGGMVFASFTNDSDAMELFLNHKEDGTEHFDKITQDGILFKREPVLIPGESRIAYIGTNNKNPTLPEDWDIYITDIENIETNKIVSGTNPVFSPTGNSFLYLRSNGIYLYSLIDGSDVLVYESDIAETENLDLSHDRKTLILSDHLGDGLSIFNISSWNPLTIEFVDGFILAALDGAFSSDDRSYATYVYSVTEEGEYSDPSIYIYDMAAFRATGAFRGEKVFDLSEYKDEYVWVSTWK